MTLLVACLWWFLARDLKTNEASGQTGIRGVFGALLKVRNIRIVLVLVPLLILMLMDTPEVGAERLGSAGGYFVAALSLGILLMSFLLRR